MTSLNKQIISNNSSTSLLENISSCSPSSTTSYQSCRICLMPVEPNELKNYCLCTGSTGVYHKHCQLEWIRVSEKTSCEICNNEFNLKPIYNLNCVYICMLIFGLIWIGGFIVLLLFENVIHSTLIMGMTPLFIVVLSLLNFCNKKNTCKIKKYDLLEIDLEQESDV